jgi:hypothetical protein
LLTIKDARHALKVGVKTKNVKPGGPPAGVVDVWYAAREALESGDLWQILFSKSRCVDSTGVGSVWRVVNGQNHPAVK